ncbi:MAG: uroporphyrinogen decarboxylase family protein [Armatimonadota bacterium]|nr:hypothetical protein [Armatimonadota bacterium]MCX7778388.1 hypothetical protein [Armatimonadota bacterium]MDW8026257.1 uroporphyrinogen decarboxylase family protein [Armatimonadota bacterium]
MSFCQMTLNVFACQPISHVLFQPRIEPWYDWHKRFGKLPKRYEKASLLEVFDDLKVSMRYVHYYTGQPDPVVVSYSERVKIHRQFSASEGTVIYETPYGELVECHKLTVDGSWRKVEFPVKSVDDLRKLRWLYANMTYSFSVENFMQGSNFMGERGEPQFWVPKSPYQALAQIWMRLENLIYALADYPDEVEATMKAIDDSYDRLYEEIVNSGVVKIVNFGENIHDQLLSPKYFERYLVPFYEKRSNQLRKHGIFTHIHIDGYFKTLLPYLKHLPFDGYEALTPKPQGDVELEEIKEYIGDKVLIDGIPAIMFIPPFTRDELMATVERIVKLFHPRLILGVSDEVPQGGGEEAIERVRMVSEWCRKFP